jgi:pSer/pThr/pTyr-binding forkhead associated (FHA) protein
MDEPRTPPEAAGLPGPGSHPRPAGGDGDGFVPLRLVLQPSGMIVPLHRRDVIVGRHSGADVRLPLPDVSRRHCRFLCTAGRWEVIDLNSLNGLWVNDARVPRADLRHGDTVRIGGFTFAVDLTPAPAAAEIDRTEVHDGLLRRIIHTLPRPEPEPRVRRKAS